MLPRIAKFKGAVLNLLFPQKCIGCGKEGVLLCCSCQQSLPRMTLPLCPKCGRPQTSDILCPACVGWQSSIDGIRSPLRFEGLVREAVHQLKYKNLRSFAAPLAGLMLEYLNQNPLQFQVLVPVPLHPKRLRERGYNQSALIAGELGRLTGLPVDSHSLLRTAYVLPQALTRSVEERRQNVKQAFKCAGDSLKDKQVLLIDDVSTSGATLDACAAALKLSGTASVWGLVLAREILRTS